MQEVVINVRVKDNEVEQLQKDLNKLGVSFDKVDKNAEKVSNSLGNVRDNGGAIAVLDNLTGGLATQLKDAAEASELFNFNLKATRGALIATGIGAFVVALGTVVAYWDEIVEFITEANKRLENQIALNKQLIDVTNSELTALDAKEKLLIAEGKNTEEIKKQRIQILNNLKAEQEALLNGLQTKLLRLKADQQELSFGNQILVTALETLGAYEKAAEVRAKSINTSQAEIDALQVEINTLQATIDTTSVKLLEAQGFTASTGATTGDGVDRPKNLKPLESFVKKEGVVRVNAEQDTANQIKAIRDNLDADLAGRYSSEKALYQATQDAKLNILQNTLALGAQIAGEESKIGKAFAVSNAIISGIEGVQNAYTTAQKSPITTLFPAYPVVQAGLAAAFSALQIKQILSVNPSGSSSAPSVGGGGGAAQSPSFNLVGSSGISQLSQQLNQDQEPIQAFVVASAVTSQQELDQNIVDGATID